MRILCLYNNDCALELFYWLKSEGHECVLWKDKLSLKWVKNKQFDLAVSYTYSKIIKADIIEELNSNIVNLHTSYLPWNRGVDPNIWSLIDNTPRGVTLHYIDSQLDKGYIIAQEMAPIYKVSTQTLKSTYDDLNRLAISLFKKAFNYFDFWREMKKQALGKGTYHTDAQGLKLRRYMDSYDDLVYDFLIKIRADENE